ncbi:MAG: Fpg/Nei family DNA glycosylase [Acidimicrobiales bacterium]
MPELVEVERYLRLAERVVGRRIVEIDVVDPHVTRGLVSDADLAAAVCGRRVSAVRRHGKLLVIEIAGGPRLGLRFGMTGTLVVDGDAGVDRLLHASAALDDRWARFRVGFAPRGELVLHDPRRLGRVELDPDEESLGPDAATATPAQLAVALGRNRASGGPALKVRLMDQSRLAGVGNLLADEVLWRAGLWPGRPAASLSMPELRRLHRHLRQTLDDLLARGGSHTGDLMAERRPGGHCPRDNAELARAIVGGRTTWWCPVHQC